MMNHYSNRCIEAHANVNHFYDGDLPYRIHLEMTNQVFQEFKHLLDDEVDYFTGKKEYDRGVDNTVTLREACDKASWGHDLIEDARLTYNDVKDMLGQEAADIIFAVTNEKGKTRKERANPKYYAGIVATKGAVYTKLCDRIANVRFGKMMKSRQFYMYKKENPEFVKSLGYELSHPLVSMFDCLFELFNEN